MGKPAAQVCAEGGCGVTAQVSASPFAAFEESRSKLLTWLQSELASSLDASSAQALHATAEVLVSGIDPAAAADADIEEVAENVGITLSDEGSNLESISREFKQRLKAI